MSFILHSHFTIKKVIKPLLMLISKKTLNKIDLHFIFYLYPKFFISPNFSLQEYFYIDLSAHGCGKVCKLKKIRILKNIFFSSLYSKCKVYSVFFMMCLFTRRTFLNGWARCDLRMAEARRRAACGTSTTVRLHYFG